LVFLCFFSLSLFFGACIPKIKYLGYNVLHMATLYRQYRPQNFSEILGQNYIKTILQNEILTDKIAQAYLFCGPRAVGKTTMARVLAKAVNCLSRKADDYEPCDKCENCLNITAGNNLDIIEIDAASNTGVDNVRDNIISSSRVGSDKNKYKVFIIDEVHMLSISAFNALLKLLEEPPRQVIFILCTTEIHKIPNTIISRCQRFDFRRIGLADMVKKMEHIVKSEGIKVDAKILETIARHSDGYMRDAESLLGQILSISDQEITEKEADLVIPHNDFKEIINFIDYLNKKDASKAIRLINNLIDNGINLKNFTVDLIEVLRKMMLAKISPNLADSLGLDYGESLELQINDLKLELAQIVRFIEKFNEAHNNLRNSFITQLPLELAVVDLCAEAKPVANIYTSQPSVNITSTPIINKSAEKLVTPNIGANPSVAITPEVTPIATAVAPLRPLEPFDSSLDMVVKNWNEVIARVKPLNHSLSFVLQTARVTGFHGNVIDLTFKYKFHKDRIVSAPIMEMLCNVLFEVYGQTLIINALIDESMVTVATPVATGENSSAGEAEILETATPAPADAKADNVISNLINAFGGEVVG